jgi:hypothetical protein
VFTARYGLNFLNVIQVYCSHSRVYTVSFHVHNTEHTKALCNTFRTFTNTYRSQTVKSMCKYCGRGFGCDWDPHHHT